MLAQYVAYLLGALVYCCGAHQTVAPAGSYPRAVKGDRSDALARAQREREREQREMRERKIPTMFIKYCIGAHVPF
jgi:hypothetical protein